MLVRVGDDHLRTGYLRVHSRLLRQAQSSRHDDHGTYPRHADDCRPMGRLPAVALPADHDTARRCTDTAPLMVVSRYLRAQRRIPQPRPHLCFLGTGALRLSAGAAVLAELPVAVGQRAALAGIRQLLSHDSCCRLLLLYTALRPLPLLFVRHPGCLLPLLRHLHLPARRRSAVLLHGCGHRPDSTGHLPRPGLLLPRPSGIAHHTWL